MVVSLLLTTLIKTFTVARDKGSMALELGFKTETVIAEGRITEEEINHMQIWLRSNGYISLSDQQVVQFLLSCDKDVELTRNTIKEYFECRTASTDIFSQRHLERKELKNMMEIAYFTIIPRLTKDGDQVLFFKLKNSDYSKFETYASLKMVTMVLDAAIHDYPPNGLVMVFDVNEASFMHLTKFSFGCMRRYIRYLQEGLPVKLKHIYAINVKYVIEKLVGWIKPMMKEYLRNLIVLHGKSLDMNTFYGNCVEKECLPSEYGGDQPSLEELNCRTIEKVANMLPFFEAEEKQREEVKNLTTYP